ncbi:interferon-activable protein 208-like [Cavia porcellus]|uniref:interferon-activable protein 208-like n=1 Tax=Cavia porcellus TaxID=10141 RepID=UPI002FE16358
MNLFGLKQLQRLNGRRAHCSIRGKVLVISPQKMEFSSGSLDDGSGSAPPDPVRQPRRQLPKEPEPCLQKRVRNQLEAEDAELVPIAAMARLQLRKSRRSQRPNLNPLPTWGQLKKLTIEGQRLVLQAGKPLNPENLFLALCALLTVASGTESSRSKENN